MVTIFRFYITVIGDGVLSLEDGVFTWGSGQTGGCVPSRAFLGVGLCQVNWVDEGGIPVVHIGGVDWLVRNILFVPDFDFGFDGFHFCFSTGRCSSMVSCLFFD